MKTVNSSSFVLFVHVTCFFLCYALEQVHSARTVFFSLFTLPNIERNWMNNKSIQRRKNESNESFYLSQRTQEPITTMSSEHQQYIWCYIDFRYTKLLYPQIHNYAWLAQELLCFYDHFEVPCAFCFVEMHNKNFMLVDRAVVTDKTKSYLECFCLKGNLCFTKFWESIKRRTFLQGKIRKRISGCYADR